jgi:hypothetical protein
VLNFVFLDILEVGVCQRIVIWIYAKLAVCSNDNLI